jgi:preprotein translocase subunit Sec63
MEISSWLQFLVLIICLIGVLAKDYYEILGIKRDASEKEIKRKFRQLGKQEQCLIIKNSSLFSFEISSR